MFCSSRKAYKLVTCTKPAQQITGIRGERASLDSQCLDLCLLDFTTGNCYLLKLYPQFPFWILIALDKIYFACIVLIRAKLDPYQ